MLAINQERGLLLVGSYQIYNQTPDMCEVLVLDPNAVEPMMRYYTINAGKEAMGNYMDVVSLPEKNGHPASRLFVSRRDNYVVAYDLDV